MKSDSEKVLIDRIKANDPALIDIKVGRNSAEILDALSHNTTVRSLNISVSSLNLCEAVQLKEMLSANVTITSIILHQVQSKEKIAQEIAHAVCNASSLTSLKLYYDELDNCDKEIVEIFDQMICRCKNLKSLLILAYPQSSNGLGEIIASHPLLEELDLRGCSFTKESAQNCAESLKSLRHLRTLAVDYYSPVTPYSEDGMDEPIITCTLSSLKKGVIEVVSRNTLATLRLCTDSFQYDDKEDARLLGSLVGKSQSLRELEIDYLNYGMSLGSSEQEFYKGFIDEFKQNSSLKKLRIHVIDGGKSNKEIWRAFEVVLSQNTVLEHLDLALNDECMSCFSQALSTNKSLLSLNLMRSFVEYEEMLEKNYRLLNLNFKGAYVEKDKVEAILKRNKFMLIKSFALLIKTLYNPEENASLVRLLPKDILIKILKLVHPGFTPMVFESFKNRLFFKPDATSPPMEDVSAISLNKSP